LAHANHIRDSLAMALEGIDAAILDVAGELGIPLPASSSLQNKPGKKR